MAQHGRGKQLFREYTRDMNFHKRESMSAHKKGEPITAEDAISQAEDIKDDYLRQLDALDIDTADIWEERIEERFNQDVDFYYDNLPSGESGGFEEEELEDDEDDFPGFIGIEEPETILGYPVISEDECAEDDDTGRGTVRGQIFETTEGLEEYIADIPGSVIKGIVLIFNEDGTFFGFSVCGLINTEANKREANT